MSNIRTTEVDIGNVLVEDRPYSYEDGLLVFGGEDTFLAGTLLARSGANFVAHVPSGGGSNTVVAVLTYEVSRAGAGNEPIRALVSGYVKKERLVVHADGDDSNITAAVRDALRTQAIIPVDTQQLSALDNVADS